MPGEMMTNAWLESDDGRAEPWWTGRENSYHAGLRSALSPEYQELSAEEIDDLVDRVMQSASPEDAEDFGSFLSDIGRAVGPIAAQVLPIAAPIVGTMIGGPAGAMVGNMVGQYAGKALGGGAAPAPRAATPPQNSAPRVVAPPAPRPVAQPVVPPPPPVSQATPEPAVAAPTATPPAAASTSALAQLIALLDSSALRQLLAGQVLGSAGVKTVPVGPENVPVSFPTMMEALSVLAGSAAQTAPAYGESAEAESTAYLRDESGRFAYDPAVPEERAAALVAHLRAGPAESEAFVGSMGEASDASVGSWLSRAGMIQ